MNRFIVLSFLVMAWGYYELSGGSDFVLETRPEPVAAAATPDATPSAASPVEDLSIVTRAETAELAELPEIDSPDDAVRDAVAAVAPGAAPEATLDGDYSSVEAALNEALGNVVQDDGPTAGEQLIATGPMGDVRAVAGDRVNMRDGPGTGYAVLGQLNRGTLAEVVETGADGWVRVNVSALGLSGWVSAEFLAPADG